MSIEWDWPPAEGAGPTLSGRIVRETVVIERPRARRSPLEAPIQWIVRRLVQTFVLTSAYVWGLAVGTLILLLWTVASHAATITDCRSLPAQDVLMPLTQREASAVCAAIVRTLDPVSDEDLQMFSKATILLSEGGYRPHEYAGITADLVEIVRLRGLYNQPKRWSATISVPYAMWNALHGAFSPADIRRALVDMGPDTAKAIRDDKFLETMVVLKIIHQRGDD